MSENETSPFRAKAVVEKGYVTVTMEGDRQISTPADYSGRIATLLETIAKYPHDYLGAGPDEETTGDGDVPFETEDVEVGAPLLDRPVIGRVDVFTAYPDPNPEVYALIDGARNMSSRFKPRSQDDAAQLGRLFRAIDEGATTVAY